MLSSRLSSRIYPVGALLKCSRYVLIFFSLSSVCPLSWVGALVLPTMTKLDTDASLPILQRSLYFSRFFNSTQFTNLINSAIPQRVVLAQLKGREHRVDIKTGREKSAQTCAAMKEKDQEKQASDIFN